MTVLDSIVSSTRARLAESPCDLRILRQRAEKLRTSRESRSFESALSSRAGGAIIAEIKAGSPSEGRILSSVEPAAIARIYARAGAAAISVVTERDHFSGDPSWLAIAGEAAGLPILMKDFVIEQRQIFEAAINGADAVLLLASLLDASRLRSFIALTRALGMDALVEIHDEAELDRAVAVDAPIIGINNRNLKDFSVSLTTGTTLVSLIPPGKIRVAESGIRSRADIDLLASAGFDAFLVGTSLLRSGDPEATLLELMGARHV